MRPGVISVQPGVHSVKFAYLPQAPMCSLICVIGTVLVTILFTVLDQTEYDIVISHHIDNIWTSF